MEEKSATFSNQAKEFFINLGFTGRMADYIVDFFALFIVFIISLILYYGLKFVINRFLKSLIKRSPSKWDDYLYHEKVFTRLAMLIPAIIIRLSIPFTISNYPSLIHYLELILQIFIVGIIILVINSFLNAVYRILSDQEEIGSKPIKGYIQVTKIIVWIFGGIIIISTLAGQKPLSILAGLGAMSAVLMLIFKDSILGFVAGVVLSNNKMVQIGDWITMPKFSVDGTVFDISLMTVKVRNFDNSVSLLPSYSMISDTFINWRSMGEAGGRRIKRSILIDVTTIRLSDQEQVNFLKQQKILPDDFTLPETEITNLGLFRGYVAYHLRNNSRINTNATLMIRQLQPTENGLPVEIYAFLTNPEWVAFEDFQSDLFEHLFAILPEFGLKPFQRSSVSEIKP